MPIPDFQTFFRPLLAFAADGIEHSIAEAREALADHFQLSETDLNQYLPSGTQKTYDNRVAWAKSYLLKANALKATRRAHFVITDRGRELLDRYPDRIDVKILNQFDEFRSFHSNDGNDSEDQTSSQRITSREETPEELLEESYNNIRDELQSELLETIKSNTPEFFEKLVVDLMLALGYGGSRKDAGESLGKSGDEGIDGTIKEDKLGLDVIYLQAKKWEGTVGRPEIQKFVGALHGKCIFRSI